MIEWEGLEIQNYKIKIQKRGLFKVLSINCNV